MELLLTWARREGKGRAERRGREGGRGRDKKGIWRWYMLVAAGYLWLVQFVMKCIQLLPH